ncbi:hypothetical protein BGZ74_000136, partial [Mortierella antarctica]
MYARQANNIRNLSDEDSDDDFDGNDSDLEEQDPQIFVEAENLDSEEANRNKSAQDVNGDGGDADDPNAIIDSLLVSQATESPAVEYHEKKWYLNYDVTKHGIPQYKTTDKRKLHGDYIKQPVNMTLDCTGITPGKYWVVLCVRLSEAGREKLPFLNLRAITHESSVGYPKINEEDWKFTSKVSRTHLHEEFPTNVWTLIWLCQHIDLDESQSLVVNIDPGQNFPKYHPHIGFLQLLKHSAVPDPGDLVVTRDCIPIVRLWDNLKDRRNGLRPDSGHIMKVRAQGISSNGERLVTYSVIEVKGQEPVAYLDVWDLTRPQNVIGDGFPRLARGVSSAISSPNPSERLDFGDLPALLENTSVKATISNDGSKLALISSSAVDTRFRLFNCDVANGAISRPSSPTSSPTTFCGVGDFHVIGGEERFVVCNLPNEESRDDVKVSVYECTTWETLKEFSLERTEGYLEHKEKKRLRRRRRLAAENLIRSLQGPFAAWTGHPKVVSTWNLLTGRTISHVPLHNGQDWANIQVRFSLDGSRFAVYNEVAVRSDREIVIAVYFTESGAFIINYGKESNPARKTVIDKFQFKSKSDTPRNYFIRGILDPTKEFQIPSADGLSNTHRTVLNQEKQLVLVRKQGPAAKVIALDQLDSNKECTSEDHGHLKLDLEVLHVTNRSYKSIIYQDRQRRTLFTFSHKTVSNRFQKYSSVYELTMGPTAAEGVKIMLSFSYKIKYAFFTEGAGLVCVGKDFVVVWGLSRSPSGTTDDCRLMQVWRYDRDIESIFQTDRDRSNQGVASTVMSTGLTDGPTCSTAKTVSPSAAPNTPSGAAATTTAMPSSSLSTTPTIFSASPTANIARLHLCPHSRWLTITLRGGDQRVLDLRAPAIFEDNNAVDDFLRGISTLILMDSTTESRRRDGQIRSSNFRLCTVRYISMYISMYPIPSQPEQSVMATLCKQWKKGYRDYYKSLLHDILQQENSWTPLPVSRYTDKSNPVTILLGQPSPLVIGSVKKLCNYCFTRTQKIVDGSDGSDARLFSYLSPVFHGMDQLLEQHPEEGRHYVSLLALFKAPVDLYIRQNHQIAYPPEAHLLSALRYCFPFVYPLPKKTQQDPTDPQLPRGRLRYLPEVKDLTLPVLSLSRDGKDSKYHKESEDRGVHFYMASPRAMWRYDFYLESEGEKKRATSVSKLWALLCHLFVPRRRYFIKMNGITYKEFNNPHMMAVIQYGWYKWGFRYWLYRFIAQALYYSLILGIVLTQGHQRSNENLLPAVFLMVIMSFIFLCMEVVRMAKQGWDYIFLIYNLFTLRVFKSVCKFVTILKSILSSIKIYLVIFILGIFAFAIAIQHLVHGCPTGQCPHASNCIGDECPDPSSEFPQDFLGSVIATFFIIVGRYDPTDEQFEKKSVPFELFMVVYVFTT